LLKANQATLGDCSTSKADMIDALALRIEVFPNPNKGEFVLSIVNAAQELNIILTDASGKQLMSKTAQPFGGQYYHTFDLGHLPAGMYFIQVSDGEKNLMEKIVIRH
jgi:hypothetical protein